jgi:RimJ/RimL family protein N-acetyltransferase
MKHILETERLYLRELNLNDEKELSCILCDSESMKYYPKIFTKEQVIDWINWNIENYIKYKHGLWAVILKQYNNFIGDCGLTIQDIEGEDLPEIGYHIKKEYCNRGYATEASQACINYAFHILNYNKLYSYMKHDNLPSIRVAEKNGMQFVKQFTKNVMGISVTEVLYCLQRQNGV